MHASEDGPSYVDEISAAMYLNLSGLGVFVPLHSIAGEFLCTIPNAHPNIMHSFRVCACERCHILRNTVYQSAAWNVSATSRAISREKLFKEE
jgi:hypothetical protein